MAKKGPRQMIMLRSTAVHEEGEKKGQPTGHQVYTEKNTRNTTDKLKLRRYDPIARKHVEYVESKIKK